MSMVGLEIAAFPPLNSLFEFIRLNKEMHFDVHARNLMPCLYNAVTGIPIQLPKLIIYREKN